MFQLTLPNETSLEHFCKILASSLSPGQIIHLNGSLGVGKTTLTRYLGQELQSNNSINSPSYGIIQSYTCQHNHIKMIHHMDFYRLNNVKDIDHLDLDQYINQNDSICIIEWSKKWQKYNDEHDLFITIEWIDENKRKLQLDHHVKDSNWLKTIQEKWDLNNTNPN